MKCFVFTKRQLMMLCAGVLASIIAVFGGIKTFAGSERKLPIYCVECEEKKVALSFDAAWGNTKKVQNIAKAHNYWVCASSVFHKNPDFNVILQ